LRPGPHGYARTVANDRVERMRTLVRLWNERGVDAWLAQASPDVIFKPDPRFPEQGPFSGARLRAFLDEWQEAWGGSSELVLHEVTEHGDAVVARCAWEVRGSSSGAFVPTEWTFVSWFDDDGAMRVLLAFFDHAEAIEAARAGREAAGA
jgi:hypothetical protein